MLSSYSEGAIQFIYPENWKVAEENSNEEDWQTVTLESPSGDEWTIYRHPADADGHQICKDVIDAITAEYSMVDESNDYQIQVNEQLLEGTQLYFYFLDLLVTVVCYFVTTSDSTFVFVYQGEDREFDKNEEVIRALTHSVISDALPTDTTESESE